MLPAALRAQSNCNELKYFLLQIPPPKPPPPEMHFIPNPANTEFIYLCGLEECVSRILNLDAVTPAMPKPFTCSQCHTDFTPTWKWDKAAKGRNRWTALPWGREIGSHGWSILYLLSEERWAHRGSPTAK